MELVFNHLLSFVSRHKKFFVVAGVLFVVYLVWSYYEKLRQAQEFGKGVGEGVKGTAAGVAEVIMQPFTIVADWIGNAADLVIGNSAASPGLEPLGYTFETPAQSEFEKNLWAGQTPGKSTVTHPWDVQP